MWVRKKIIEQVQTEKNKIVLELRDYKNEPLLSGDNSGYVDLQSMDSLDVVSYHHFFLNQLEIPDGSAHWLVVIGRQEVSNREEIYPLAVSLDLNEANVYLRNLVERLNQNRR